MNDLKELHGEVNTISLSVRDLQIARPCGPSADHHCVVRIANGLCVGIYSNIRIRHEGLYRHINQQTTNNVLPTLTTPSAVIKSRRL